MKLNQIFFLTILVTSIADAKIKDRIEYKINRVLTSLTTTDGATGDSTTRRSPKNKKQTRRVGQRVRVKK